MEQLLVNERGDYTRLRELAHGAFAQFASQWPRLCKLLEVGQSLAMLCIQFGIGYSFSPPYRPSKSVHVMVAVIASGDHCWQRD